MKRIFIILCVLLTLVGCSNNVSNSDTNINDEQNGDIKEETINWVVDPNSTTRPFAVMINCHNNALPQSDINKAYLVYELMVEGGITRMLALFKDTDAVKIGSIRSARSQYLGYVLENDAIYVSAGGSSEAIREIDKLKINRIDVDNNLYGMRDKTLKRDWEHTLFTSIDLLKKGANNYNYRTTSDSGLVFKYSESEVDLSKYSSSIEANNISIKYSDYRRMMTYDQLTINTYYENVNCENVELEDYFSTINFYSFDEILQACIFVPQIILMEQYIYDFIGDP